MKPEPLVSVVTPVYNGAEFLEECIESLMKQTYRNWEHTIIDNASTDATPDLAERYAAKDSRIRLLHFDEFVDARENHNRAIRAIHPESEFCKVVQADDWLFPECLTRMVDAAQVSDTIGVVSAYRLWDDIVDLVGLPYSKTFARGSEILRQSLLGGPYVTGGPTALLFRSSVVRERDPFYRPGFQHEDTEAAYWILSRHDFGYVHQVLTFARRQLGARLETAGRVGTYVPENIRFLLLYGPLVLEPSEQRARLREDLRKYVRFHVRQSPKPSRLADPEFFALHLAETASILEESNGDAEVRAAMAFIRALLLRGGRRGREKRMLGSDTAPPRVS